ncbi:MAG: hypothetical protein ACUVRG_06455 [Ignavibacterium sp.]|uniref:hypothetical protein n=1 Tax=Ignavibacterium sp. TaxID=2651167 RepID=UPI004049A46A
MKKKDWIMILISVTILLLIAGYYFFYNIYEIKVEISPKHLYSELNSTIEIKVVPINVLGSKALFRSTKSEFEIIEGAPLVEIVFLDKQLSILKLKSKGLEGKVGIKIYNSHSLFPQYVEILILPLRV